MPEKIDELILFFSEDGLFHKIFVLSIMGFCTCCCNLQIADSKTFLGLKLANKLLYYDQEIDGIKAKISAATPKRGQNK